MKTGKWLLDVTTQGSAVLPPNAPGGLEPQASVQWELEAVLETAR